MTDHVITDPLIPGVDYTLVDHGQCNPVHIRISGMEHKLSKSSSVEFNLIMMRHGETKKNCEKNRMKSQIHRGSDSDMSYDTEDLLDELGPLLNYLPVDLGDKNSELNEQGHLQAQEFGNALQDIKDYQIQRVITSGMTRAIQTGQIISDILQIEPEIDTDLHFDDKSVQIRASRLIRLITEVGHDFILNECDSSTGVISTVLFVTHNQTLDAMYRTCHGFTLSKTKYHNCQALEFRIELSSHADSNIIDLRISEKDKNLL